MSYNIINVNNFWIYVSQKGKSKLKEYFYVNSCCHCLSKSTSHWTKLYRSRSKQTFGSKWEKDVQVENIKDIQI